MAISSIIYIVKIAFSIILYIWGFGQSMSDHLSPVGSIDFIISHGNGRCSSSKSGTTAVLCINKCIGATTQALQVDESHDLQPETIFSARSQIHSSICVSHILSTVLQAVWTFPVSQDSSLRNAATWQGVAWDWASTPQWSHLLGKYPTTSAPLRFTQWRNRPWTYMDFLEMIIYSSTWQRQIPHPQCFYRKDEWALELICGITQYPVRDCQGSIDFSNTSAPAPGELGQLRRPHIVEFQVSQILRLIAWLPWTGTPACTARRECLLKYQVWWEADDDGRAERGAGYSWAGGQVAFQAYCSSSRTGPTHLHTGPDTLRISTMRAHACWCVLDLPVHSYNAT